MLDSNVLVSCVRGYSIGNHSVYNFTCAILVRTSSQRRRRSASASVIGCRDFTTQINSGDQIEIITADNARPKPEWLETVTTAKAKQSIKSFLKRERQNNIERGMQMLDEKMKSLIV